MLDYRALDGFKTLLDAEFDHRHLNDVMHRNPTAENLAREFYEDAFRSYAFTTLRVSAVRVSETEKTWAEYRPTTTPTPTSESLLEQLEDTLSDRVAARLANSLRATR